MTTAELIEAFRKLDPEGDHTVTISRDDGAYVDVTHVGLVPPEFGMKEIHLDHHE